MPQLALNEFLVPERRCILLALFNSLVSECHCYHVGSSDEGTPIVAGQVYRYLFRNRLHGCDPSEAAAPLNRAILCLRQNGNVTVDRWALLLFYLGT